MLKGHINNLMLKLIFQIVFYQMFLTHLPGVNQPMGLYCVKHCADNLECKKNLNKKILRKFKVSISVKKILRIQGHVTLRTRSF